MSTDAWRRCSSCKTDIPFGSTYWVCNVSTCNRARTGLFFCAVCLLHLYRALSGGPLIIGAIDAPVWISWIAVIVSGYLGFTALRPSSPAGDS